MDEPHRTFTPGPEVKFTKLRAHASVPQYAKAGDAGADVVFCPADGEPEMFVAGDIKILDTGICVQVPDNWEAQVRSRSGNATRGLFVLNSPGTVDSGYRGELRVILHYVGPGPTFTVRPGDRIAQLVVAPCFQAIFSQVESLDASDRGAGGFGSTGK